MVRGAYPEAEQSGIEPAAHYVWSGWQKSCQPNPYFDTGWYLETNPDVVSVGMNPLLHYVRRGDLEGRQPAPYFDPGWYRMAYDLGCWRKTRKRDALRSTFTHAPSGGCASRADRASPCAHQAGCRLSSDRA